MTKSKFQPKTDLEWAQHHLREALRRLPRIDDCEGAKARAVEALLHAITLLGIVRGER